MYAITKFRADAYTTSYFGPSSHYSDLEIRKLLMESLSKTRRQQSLVSCVINIVVHTCSQTRCFGSMYISTYIGYSHYRIEGSVLRLQS